MAGLQILLHQPQHLVGLVHFDEAFFQAEPVAQRRHATDVNAGDARTAEIQRNPVGGAMRQRGEDPFMRGHNLYQPLR